MLHYFLSHSSSSSGKGAKHNFVHTQMKISVCTTRKEIQDKLKRIKKKEIKEIKKAFPHPPSYFQLSTKVVTKTYFSD